MYLLIKAACNVYLTNLYYQMNNGTGNTNLFQCIYKKKNSHDFLYLTQ